MTLPAPQKAAHDDALEVAKEYIKRLWLAHDPALASFLGGAISRPRTGGVRGTDSVTPYQPGAQPGETISEIGVIRGQNIPPVNPVHRIETYPHLLLIDNQL